MPTYDYRCDACGHEFEEWQSFTAEKLTKCPVCKKNKLVRLFGSGAAIVFKGSGFYDTDYRQADEKKKTDRQAKNAPAEAKADGAAESSGGDKSDGKGEAKTDAPKTEPAAAKESAPVAKAEAKPKGKPKGDKGD